MGKHEEFCKALSLDVNVFSRENASNTPDFILGEFMGDCLMAFEKASTRREKWYGKELRIGNNLVDLPTGEPSEKSLQIAARIWCDQDMKSVVMDTDAARTIARILDAVIEAPKMPEIPNVVEA